MCTSVNVRWLGLLGIVAGVVAPAAQQPRAPDPAAVANEPAGLLLSDSVIEAWLRHQVAQMAEKYEFDDYQQELAQEAVLKRVPQFLRENRAEVQRLVNEFLQARYNPEAPTPEFAADWSLRALPLLQKGQSLLYTLADDLREFMTDEQQIKLDGYLAGMEVAVQFTANRLQGWAEGHFDPETDWPGTPAARKLDRQRREKLEQEMNTARDQVWAQVAEGRSADSAAGTSAAMAPAAAGQPPTARPRATTRADEWERYVEDFIRRYDLNPEQQQKARLYLSSQKRSRDQYLVGKADQMSRLEKRYAQAAQTRSRAQLDAAEAEYTKLVEPIDRMFEVLKQKLDTLPTRKQREQAANRDLQAASPQPSEAVTGAKPPASEPPRATPR